MLLEGKSDVKVLQVQCEARFSHLLLLHSLGRVLRSLQGLVVFLTVVYLLALIAIRLRLLRNNLLKRLGLRRLDFMNLNGLELRLHLRVFELLRRSIRRLYHDHPAVLLGIGST